MMRSLLLLYIFLGVVLAPFLMMGTGVGRRQPWFTVGTIWLVLALVWPFAVADYCLFYDGREEYRP